MRATCWLCLALVLFVAGLSGCKEPVPEKPKGPSAQTPSEDDERKVNFGKLDEPDRKLAEAQVFCAVEHKSRLGSMGTPYKLVVKDQPVFLCCKSCQRRALADPEKTLANVAELKKKSALP